MDSMTYAAVMLEQKRKTEEAKAKALKEAEEKKTPDDQEKPNAAKMPEKINPAPEEDDGSSSSGAEDEEKGTAKSRRVASNIRDQKVKAKKLVANAKEHRHGLDTIME